MRHKIQLRIFEESLMREKFIAKVGEVTGEFNLLNLRNGEILKNSDNYNYRGFSVFFKNVKHYCCSKKILFETE